MKKARLFILALKFKRMGAALSRMGPTVNHFRRNAKGPSLGIHWASAQAATEESRDVGAMHFTFLKTNIKGCEGRILSAS
ncbi:unnamed protein product [Prunus brigantina]